MDALQEIQWAIGRLSSADRQKLAAWLHTDEDRIAEPAVAYDRSMTRQPITVEEYLKLEETSTVRHEYVAGELFAMSGASRRHNRIAGNVFSALRTHLDGGPCHPYITDLKVGLSVGRDEFYYYPDVLVVCGAEDLASSIVRDPKLVLEVLSPSTQRVDRQEKAVNYRHIPSLDEYILVAQDRPEVTIYRREDNWLARILTDLEEVAEFRSLALSLRLERLYAGIF